MEAFSLLKYWRGGGGGGGGGLVAGDVSANAGRSTTGTTTIVTAVTHQTNETDEDDDDDDDGPFFDLEFAVPDEDEGDGGDEQENNEDDNINRGDNGEEEEAEAEEEEENDDVESTGTDGEREFNFTLSSGSNGGRTDPALSPSDDLFFKGRLVPIEPSSLALNASEPNSKLQFPVSLLKSATKFRVFMLGLKKSKSTATEKTDSIGSASSTPKPQQNQESQQKQQSETQQQPSKFFTVKFKVEEVPIVSLFTRDNSSRGVSGNKSQKPNSDESASDEKLFSKEVMQRYLKKVKPLYVRVSKRYGEKLRFSGQLSLGSGPKAAQPPPSPPPPTKSTAVKSESEGEVVETAASNVKSQKQGNNLPAGLRVVCKHLGKSRSASSAVAAVPSGPAPSRRRDDSLLQQQDGIQSAILHCKRSFNASRDAESTVLSRSASDPSHEKAKDASRKNSKEVRVDARVGSSQS